MASSRVTAQDAWLARELSKLAVDTTGFDMEAIRPRTVERVLERILGSSTTREELIRRIAARDVALLRELREVIVVGETYFYRQPEHFRYIAEQLAAGSGSGDAGASAAETTPIRAWSAGCATGEEAYSLAATLLASTKRPVEVLGSDLLERNLAVAEGAVYSPRAVRPSGPVLHPTFVEATGSSPGNHITVRPAVREVVRFLPHNLLEPLPAPQAAPQGRGFDIILCRNVLVYFHPEAVRLVARHLVEALKPGGLLVTGTMDFVSAPAGTQLVGPPELQVFRRIEPAPEARVVARPERSTSPVSAPPGPVPPAATPETAPEPIALHVRALTHVELGEHKEAESLLTELQRHAPEYVPGVMEQALFCVRRGDHPRAVALMREVLRRVEGLPADDIVDGPEPLTARFYQDSVRAFLERHGEE